MSRNKGIIAIFSALWLINTAAVYYYYYDFYLFKWFITPHNIGILKRLWGSL